MQDAARLAFVTLCAAALVLSCFVCPALADEDEQEVSSAPVQVEQPQIETYNYNGQLEYLGQLLANQNDLLREVKTSNNELLALLVADTHEGEEVTTVEEEEPSEEVKLLEHIDDSLSMLSGSVREEEQEIQYNVERAATQAFVCYGNVAPTGTYASYAAGFIPRLGWSDNYVYLQDTNGSYVMVMGKLTSPDANTIVGNNCEWIRWYYSGSNGYVVERGSGNVSVTLNNHMVCSDLPSWPLLGDASVELQRRELMFYAIVATVWACLAVVWRFGLRMRTSVVSE